MKNNLNVCHFSSKNIILRPLLWGIIFGQVLSLYCNFFFLNYTFENSNYNLYLLIDSCIKGFCCLFWCIIKLVDLYSVLTLLVVHNTWIEMVIFISKCDPQMHTSGFLFCKRNYFWNILISEPAYTPKHSNYYGTCSMSNHRRVGHLKSNVSNKRSEKNVWNCCPQRR